MNEHPYRSDLPPPPPRIAKLPLDERGFPVPWFVAWIDGVPDFRVAEPQRLVEAVRRKVCWVCGEPLGRHLAFVIGPMCAVNRISAEPPLHRDCAEYAAVACPFLSRPRMKRNEKDLPADHIPASGFAIMRNPGVTLVWMTRGYQLVRPPGGGVLFRIGDPTETHWYCEGRPARRAEVMASVESGLPFLEEKARTEAGGMEALAAERARAEPIFAAVPE